MIKGVEFFLKSIGVTITPEELEAAFEQGKNALPRIASAYEEMNTRMRRMEGILIESKESTKRVEAKLELLLSRTSGEVTPDPVHESELANVSAHELQNAFVNGAPELVVRNA